MIQENFIKLYEQSFRENWDLPCYTDYGEDESYSYGQVAQEIAKLHLLFKHCSLRRGDKIAIIGKNNARWCIAYMATITYGAIVVPQGSFYPLSDGISTHISSTTPSLFSSLRAIPSGNIWKKNAWPDCVPYSPFPISVACISATVKQSIVSSNTWMKKCT